MSGWILVSRWDEYQHRDALRRQGAPLWIKNYTRLLSDDDYLELSVTQRAVLHGLWLLYAKSAGKVSENTASLSRKLGLRVTKRTLDSLSDAGFIEFVASKPASNPLEELPAQRRREEIRESSNLSSELQDVEVANGRGSGWVDNLSSYTGCRYVRGEFALTAIHDPLGTEPPPFDWPHPRPTRKEIQNALREAHAESAT